MFILFCILVCFLTDLQYKNKTYFCTLFCLRHQPDEYMDIRCTKEQDTVLTIVQGSSRYPQAEIQPSVELRCRGADRLSNGNLVNRMTNNMGYT